MHHKLGTALLARLLNAATHIFEMTVLVSQLESRLSRKHKFRLATK